jgi:hypothetical protein
MLYTCYNYYSNGIKTAIIFIKDKNIINVYSNHNDDYYGYENTILFVITEEDIEKYPILYKIYITSILLTEDSTKLNKDEYGYCISKKSIWKNLYITKYYDCFYTYMTNYPKMSYILSTEEHISQNMNIIYSVKIIKPKLLCGLIEDEIYKLEKDLSICEDYTKNLAMYSIYMKNIIPYNIPDDLTNMIFEKL